MATASTVVATVEPVFTEPEWLALAGFLAGYAGLTREAYSLGLRQYASWCQRHQLRLFQARRADIECFARDLEARGWARASITRRPQADPQLGEQPPAQQGRWGNKEVANRCPVCNWDGRGTGRLAVIAVQPVALAACRMTLVTVLGGRSRTGGRR